MIEEFAKGTLSMFIDMSTYLVIGVFFVGVLNSFVDKKTIIKHMGNNSFKDVVKASLIGVPLPLCSCGVVPTAIQLKKEGGSNGSVVSFLVSTPQTGVDSIIATYGLMGPVMAVYRPFAAFVSGIVSGVVVNIFSKGEDVLRNDSKNSHVSCCEKEHVHSHETINPIQKDGEDSAKTNLKEGENKTFYQKFIGIFKYGFGEFLEEISTHFIIGIFISALISVLIPENFFMTDSLNSDILAMVVMVIVGIPMYICSTSSIPIALSLILKGMSPGAAFVFLFAGPVTNIASLIVINKTLKKKTMSIYVASTIIMSIIFGVLFNFIVGALNLEYISYAVKIQEEGGTPLISYIFAIILFIILLKISAKKILKKFRN